MKIYFGLREYSYFKKKFSMEISNIFSSYVKTDFIFEESTARQDKK